VDAGAVAARLRRKCPGDAAVQAAIDLQPGRRHHLDTSGAGGQQRHQHPRRLSHAGIYPDGTRLYMGNDGGMYSTEDISASRVN